MGRACLQRWPGIQHKHLGEVLEVSEHKQTRYEHQPKIYIFFLEPSKNYLKINNKIYK